MIIVIGGKKYFHSDSFRNLLEEEFLFFVSSDQMRMKFDKINFHRLLSFSLSNVRIYERFGEHKDVLNIEKFRISLKILLRKRLFVYEFQGVIDSEKYFAGTFAVPMFADIYFLKKKKPKNLEATAGNLSVNFHKLPLKFISALLRGKISPVLENNIYAELTGSLIFQKKRPYTLSSSFGQGEILFSNVSVRKEAQTIKLRKKTVLLPEELVFLNPIQSIWHFQGGKLSHSESIKLTAENYSGNMSVSGEVFFEENREPIANILMMGSDDLFRFFKGIFRCPLKQKKATLRGFKTISCF